MAGRGHMFGWAGRSKWLAFPALMVLSMVLSIVVVGCAEEEPENGAIEAQEENTVQLGGIQYRISTFRQLNPREPADRVLLEERTEPDNAGFYAAFIRACNVSDESQAPTNDIDLVDAFGQSFPRVNSESPVTYDPETLRPGECLPQSNSVAATRFAGSGVIYEIPFDQLDDRPFVLSITEDTPDGQPEEARIVLDL